MFAWPKRTVFLLSILVCFYFSAVILYTLSGAHWMLAGVFIELLTIPMLLLQVILFIVTVRCVLQEGFRSPLVIISLLLLVAACGVWLLD